MPETALTLTVEMLRSPEVESASWSLPLSTAKPVLTLPETVSRLTSRVRPDGMPTNTSPLRVLASKSPSLRFRMVTSPLADLALIPPPAI